MLSEKREEGRPWLKTNASETLEKATEEKISAIRMIEDTIPGVIIIQDLFTQSIVYMSARGLKILGLTLAEVQLSLHEYNNNYFNPEDTEIYVPKILTLIEENDSDESISYFQQVKDRQTESWKWYMSSTKIFLRDELNKARLIITIAIPVDSVHPVTVKMEKLLEENSFLRSHHHIFDALTRREKFILKFLAAGKTSPEIARELHISEATANTHRKNIRKKLGAQSSYDLSRFARAFDLI